MRRPYAAWLSGCACLLVALSACAPRDRINARCQWIGDAGGALDLADPGDWQHLVADAQLAEDLAIRYDDAEEARGIGGPVGARCLAALVAAIRSRHEVTDADVQRAGAYRNPAFDRAVLGSFIAVAAVVLWFACRAAHRRHMADPPVVRVGAAALMALAGCALAVPFSSLWIVTSEMVRLGNDHISAARAATPPGEPVQAILVAGACACSLALLVGERKARRSTG